MGKILEKVMKNTGKMQKILEKLMKKYWKNAKETWKSPGNSSVQKSGNHALLIHHFKLICQDVLEALSLTRMLNPPFNWSSLLACRKISGYFCNELNRSNCNNVPKCRVSSIHIFPIFQGKFLFFFIFPLLLG